MAGSWWKKLRSSRDKSDLDISKILRLSDVEYAAFVANFVDGLDPGTRAHLAVAYQNLLQIVSVIGRLAKERNEEFSIESFIRDTARRLPSVAGDEIESRRTSWFLFAAIVMRLEKIARSSNAVDVVSATIWTIIVTEYPRLRILLPNNVVWTSDEKVWFDVSMNDSALMQHGINFDIPPKFARTDVVRRFAQDLGLLYFPTDSRIGFVP